MVLTKFFLLLCLAGFCMLANGASDDELARVRALMNGGQFDQAIEGIERIMSEYPGDMDGRFMLALVLVKQGQTDAAITVFKDLTLDHPDLYESFNNLAVLYAARGNFEEAREALLNAIKGDPSAANAHENLGDLYAMMAAAAYEQALVLDQQNQTASTKLAMVTELFSSKSSPPGSVPTEAESGPVIAEPSVTAVDINQQVLAFVQHWAEAWSAQDADAYLGFYDEAYRPSSGMTRSQWQTQRRERLETPRFIEVSIRDAQVQSGTDNHVLVKFVQLYHSDSFSDETRKMLELLHVDGNWKIFSEELTH